MTSIKKSGPTKPISKYKRNKLAKERRELEKERERLKKHNLQAVNDKAMHKFLQEGGDVKKLEDGMADNYGYKRHNPHYRGPRRSILKTI